MTFKEGCDVQKANRGELMCLRDDCLIPIIPLLRPSVLLGNYSQVSKISLMQIYPVATGLAKTSCGLLDV